MTLTTSHPQTVDAQLSDITHNYDKLCVVADFDGTLTQYFDTNGTSRPSLISLLRDEWILDEDYSTQTKQMYTHYSAVEHDLSLALSDRFSHMQQRWTKHKELLIQKWLTKQHLEHITTMDRISMRPGTDTLLQQCHIHNIPVVIFSASGIGTNTIMLLLQHWDLYYPNISIISNELYRDKNWHMSWYSTPIIHSLNKTEAVLEASPVYQATESLLSTKNYFIVLGDGLWDATMINSRPDRTILKIGLCNDKVEERLATYQELFDIVLTHDDNFNEINKLLF